MSTSVTTSISIAPATGDDIETVAHVYQAAAEDLSDRLRAKNPWASLAARSEDFEQAVGALRVLWNRDPRSVVLARNQRGVVGMGAVSIEAPHAHIAFLFVTPQEQNAGIGRALLQALRDRIDAAGATVVTLASSRDPKAWQRYMQFGLVPGPPQLPFRSASPSFSETAPKHERLETRPITSDDLSILCNLDLAVRGAQRSDRIAAWLAKGNNGLLVQDHQTGRPQGYALIDLTAHWAQIGPVVALELDDFPFALESALHLAGSTSNPKNLSWRVDLSARNRQAIAPLLRAGFSAQNLVNWFESAPVGLWDRYIFRNEDEL